MANGVVWSTIHIGTFADMDTHEGTAAMETPSALLGTYGAGPGNAMANHIVDVISNAGFDTSVSTNNTATHDNIQYNLGDGLLTAKIDSVALLHTIVTFYDGTTFESDVGVIQDTNGNVFMLLHDSQPELASVGIDTIQFTSVVTTHFTGVEQTTKDDFNFVCFGPGTRIGTPFGPRRADHLRVGDLVTTLDDGPQPIRWIGKRRLRFSAPHPSQPVQIAAGALGPGLPRRAPLLSPNHRVLIATRPTHALHDPLGALAPAKALTRQRGIRPRLGSRAITYFTLLLPLHAVILAEGIAVESLYPGPEVFARLSGPERSDWMRLAAEARVTGVPPARLLLSTAEARAGLEAGAMALPATAPRAQAWTARHRRARPLPRHLAG